MKMLLPYYSLNNTLDIRKYQLKFDYISTFVGNLCAHF